MSADVTDDQVALGTPVERADRSPGEGGRDRRTARGPGPACPRMARDRRGRRPGGADRRDRPVAGHLLLLRRRQPRVVHPAVAQGRHGAARGAVAGLRPDRLDRREPGGGGRLRDVQPGHPGQHRPHIRVRRPLLLPPRSWWSSSRSSRWARTCWPASTAPAGCPPSSSPRPSRSRASRSGTRRPAGRPVSWPSPGSPTSGGRRGGTRVAG